YMLAIHIILRPPPLSTLFPYTTLFRSNQRRDLAGKMLLRQPDRRCVGTDRRRQLRDLPDRLQPAANCEDADCQCHKYEKGDNPGDRKSTRLNSSHRTISYAVFCLKKKS